MGTKGSMATSKMTVSNVKNKQFRHEKYKKQWNKLKNHNDLSNMVN